jgi:hypothetical protein
MKRVRTVNLILCAVVYLTVSLVQANAHGQFEAAVTCTSEPEASCFCLQCSPEPVECVDSRTMFEKCGLFEQWGIAIGGHLEQGITTNSRNPTNPAAGVGNFPATQMNFRNDEYMFNSLYLTIGRKTDTGGSGWDIGGNMDLMYGTNYIFLQSRGLETNRDLTNRWNSDTGSGVGGVGLMGLALPQLYLEVAHDDLTVQVGHFYLPLGYERQIPTENTFYSNSYGFTFSFETFQVLGLYADWKLNDKLQIGGGFHRGMGNWADNNNDLSGFGTATWLGDDGNQSLSFVFSIGNEADIGTETLYVQSLIFEQKISDRSSYVLHSDFGCQQNVLPGGETARWYNVVQELAYEINHCWSAGLRFEWFDDVNGFAVSPTPGPGVFYDLTLGLNYRPCDRLIVRPEVRWDWFDADTGVGPGPFGNGTERSQFMAAMDVIFSF